MKLELIDSIPLSNEIIDSFYKNLEQQQKNAERLEELEYNKSKTIITRRKFMQYSALGAVGLGLGLSTEKAEAFWPIVPSVIWLITAYLKANEPADGKVIIVNNTYTTKSSEIKLELESSEPIDSNYKTAKYEVPAGRRNIYRYRNGPSAYVKKDTRAHIVASNEYARVKSGHFMIHAYS